MENKLRLEMAYCGLECETCPVHLATLETDSDRQSAMREEIADQLTRIYRIKMLPEGVTDCDGCKTEAGRLFSGCSGCGIRVCASRKNIDNCAYCPEYQCETLKKHFLLDPESEKRLEKIKNKH